MSTKTGFLSTISKGLKQFGDGAGTIIKDIGQEAVGILKESLTDATNNAARNAAYRINDGTQRVLDKRFGPPPSYNRSSGVSGSGYGTNKITWIVLIIFAILVIFYLYNKRTKSTFTQWQRR